MPDLDNMAKGVRGSWKKAVHAGIQAPEKIGQMLAHILSRCAVKIAGEGHLRAFSGQLAALAALPLAQREQAFRQMQFPTTPEGRDVAASAARNVGKLICAGQVDVSAVGQVLAREFLLAITRTEFFGRLTEPDMVKVFGSVEAAKAHLACAGQELQDYVEGAAPEFAGSLFARLPAVEKPDLPKLSTAEQMDLDLDVNLAALDDGDEP